MRPMGVRLMFLEAISKIHKAPKNGNDLEPPGRQDRQQRRLLQYPDPGVPGVLAVDFIIEIVSSPVARWRR